MADFELDWKGDQVGELLFNAAEAAVDELTAEAAKRAEAEAPRDRPLLAISMQNEPAERDGADVVGRWGADEAAFHAVAVEVTHPTKAGFMRRIHDTVSRKLAAQIRARVG